MATNGHSVHLHFTPEQAEAIREELEEILKSTHFAGSQRCRDFLAFVVDRSLGGDTENLTERFIGADLFGRPLDYDTKSDSIVRVCANDVRRRLSEYHSHRLSVPPVAITLTSGNYLPEFHFPERPEPVLVSTAVTASEVADRPEASDTSAQAHVHVPTRGRRISLLVLAAILILLGTFLLAHSRKSATPQNDLEAFWQPILQNRFGVIVCLADSTSFWLPEPMRQAVEAGRPLPLEKAGQISTTKGDFASSGNIRAALSMMSLLDHHGVHNELLWPQEAQASDLEKSNVIYVGAFSNPATINLNENLRFSFKYIDGPSPEWMIVDHSSDGNKWSTTKTYPAPIQQDYALITRVFDPERSRVMISVGGLNWFGTQAAGEFLTDQTALAEFARTAPAGWEHKNIQIVLQMAVIGRRAVNPRIIATNIW